MLAICGVAGKISMSPISTLSGGEQCKVKICILSNKECNFLILDEIANHLDVTSKEVLKEQLQQ
jgi:ATPase subunit of ABC transporter with duplicated ATPase domains